MAKIAFTLLFCLTLHSVLSYYGPQQSYPRVVYRHPVTPYQQQAVPYQQQVSPYQQQVSYAQTPMVQVLPVVPTTVHYAAVPPPHPQASHVHHVGAARHIPYFAPPPMSPVPHPPPPPHHHYHHPYIPSASHQQSFYSPSYGVPPAPIPRRPIKSMFDSINPYGSFSHNVPKSSIFSKIKPYIFGGTGPRSLPHHPYYPNYFHPHQFTPNRPFINRPSAHHAYPVHAPPPGMHQSPVVMNPQKSCSCSLHVGQITVYKHTDMRSSYSCDDLKDCNSFCTNLFSSEDLRAQTRADACLIIGKDGKFPWFRRDHVCEPHGTKNDTNLSVDLCCKNLQSC